MEYSYEILSDHQLIIEHITGEVTVEELVDKTKAVFSDPKYVPTYSGVMDLRKAVSGMNKVELYGFAGLMSEMEMFGQSKWAIIGNDPIVVALSQIFKQRMPDQDTIGVFGSVRAAAKFVNNPEVLKHLDDD